MLAPLLALLLLTSSIAVAPPPPAEVDAVGRVPEEPGVVVLPDEATTLQAVAADMDGDGAREVVRLVDGENGSLTAEAFTETGGGWEPAGTGVVAVPERIGLAELAYGGRPVQLLVRKIDGEDRVTLLRQPDFTEPGDAEGCCLLFHDLLLSDGALRLDPVADPRLAADAVHVVDLDGDGTDELLATRSLPPLGDTSFPTEARVFRWTDAGFGPPTTTVLPVGSGDTPFVLGDSDGEPGDEMAIISVTGRSALFRIHLGDRDAMVLEDAGFDATGAIGVPIDGGRGIAVLGSGPGLEVRAWPRGERPGEPIATAALDRGTFLGLVDILDEPRVLVRQTAPEALHALGLPNLTPPGAAITRSPAAAGLEAGPLTAYAGPMPGGGLDGEPAVLYAGRLLPSTDLPDAPFATLDAALFATLAGSDPVGLVGRDRGWLAVQHAPVRFIGRDGPLGGRLAAPAFQPGSFVSVVPVDVARRPETDAGQLDLPVEGGTPIGGGELAIGPAGISVQLEAPPGSRVYVSEADPSVLGPAQVVGPSGRIRVAAMPPPGVAEIVSYRLSLYVATPGGHGYRASWPVRILVRAPEIDATVSTPFGSPDVEVRGRTASYASLEVAGRPVTVDPTGHFVARVPLPPWPTGVLVVARDPAGNEATLSLSGVGLFDYRGLPWGPIAILVVAVAAFVLFLRVPRLRTTPRPVTDDAVLEEMEPD